VLSHLINRYDLWVVGNGVNFFKSTPPAGNLLYAGPPFQGRFADIVSRDKEGGFFYLGPLGSGRSEQGEYRQANKGVYE